MLVQIAGQEAQPLHCGCHAALEEPGTSQKVEGAAPESDHLEPMHLSPDGDATCQNDREQLSIGRSSANSLNYPSGIMMEAASRCFGFPSPCGGCVCGPPVPKGFCGRAFLSLLESAATALDDLAWSN